MSTSRLVPLASRIITPEASPTQQNPVRFVRRVACVALILLLEVVLLSLWLDTGLNRGGLMGWVDNWSAPFVRSVIAAATVFAALAYSRGKTGLIRLSARLEGAGISWSILGVHLVGLAALGALSFRLFGDPSRNQPNLVVLLWAASAAGVAWSCVLAFLPAWSLLELVRCTGRTWAYAMVAAGLSYPLGELWSRLWQPTADLTFHLVAWMLRPLLSGLVVDSAAQRIGTGRFTVEIAQQCSGLEGIGLILIFSAVWLWISRDEYRIARALLVIPVGVLAIWLLNTVRISALILIGNAGAERIAAGGFHSQAGWIAFNGVALGLMMGLQRVPWLKKAPEKTLDRSKGENPTAAYLMPFLAIVAAGMISHAASGGFEWLYPLRFAAAVAALVFYRSRYSGINWKFGGGAVLLGVVVFAFWVLMDRLFPGHADNGLELAVKALPAPAKIMWLTFRVLAAVITVPIAEELAFRGFLLRRISGERFEDVDFRRCTLVAVAISSIAFGLMHGDRWAAGAIAGAIYAAAVMHRGRMGDAVAAHATTNALLAGWVVWGGHWNFW